jgi:2-polyprenyl-3-methyl-5-hydroxy-6-metoxy-1,4-benzoquinol methylase
MRGYIPQSTDDLRVIYDKIYRADRPRHPVKGLLGLYGTHTNRDAQFIAALAQLLPPNGQDVLDASCGRGHLLKELIRIGYNAHGTEFVEYLVRGELKNLPVELLAYDELQRLGENRFDAVVSNDVMEHMVDEEAAYVAARNLCHISRRYVMVSVGRGIARKYPDALKLAVRQLHFVVKEIEWWLDLFGNYMRVIYTSGRFFVGEV